MPVRGVEHLLGGVGRVTDHGARAGKRILRDHWKPLFQTTRFSACVNVIGFRMHHCDRDRDGAFAHVPAIDVVGKDRRPRIGNHLKPTIISETLSGPASTMSMVRQRRMRPVYRSPSCSRASTKSPTRQWLPSASIRNGAFAAILPNTDVGHFTSLAAIR